MTIAAPRNVRTLRELPPRATAGAGRGVAGSIEMMRQMIEAAFAGASRHSSDCRFVMVKADSFEFRRDACIPRATARVVFAGRSSLTVVVELADDGDHFAASGRFMLMAVDNDGAPVPVSQNQNPEEIRP